MPDEDADHEHVADDDLNPHDDTGGRDDPPPTADEADVAPDDGHWASVDDDLADQAAFDDFMGVDADDTGDAETADYGQEAVAATKKAGKSTRGTPKPDSKTTGAGASANTTRAAQSDRKPARAEAPKAKSKKSKKAKKRPQASVAAAPPAKDSSASLHRLLWAVLVVLVALIVVGGGLLWWRSREPVVSDEVALDAGRPPSQAPYQKWKINPGCADCRLAADDSAVYMAYPAARKIVAYDLESSAEKWSVPLSFEPRQLALRSGTLLTGTGLSDNLKSAAIDARAGSLRWEHEGLLTIPTDPAPGGVLVETDDGNGATTHYVDVTNGQDRWATGGSPWRVCGDTTIVGDDQVVRAVGTGDGQERWRAEASTISNIGCTATVVAGLADTYAVAWNRSTGEQLWRRDAHTSALAVAGDLVLLAGEELVAVDAATGADRWTAETGDFVFSARMSPPDRLITFGSGATLRDRSDGRPIAFLPGDNPDQPALVETPDGFLHREGTDRVTLRDAVDFTSSWTVTSVSGVTAMTAGGGRLVVLDTQGDLVAYA